MLEAVGVEEQLDISNLPADLEAKKPARWRRILGAIVFGERTVFVDRTQPQPRQLFTDAHEATHAMCPWHEATLLLDGESTMFRDVKDIIEAEANYGAGRLISCSSPRCGSRPRRSASRSETAQRVAIWLKHHVGQRAPLVHVDPEELCRRTLGIQIDHQHLSGPRRELRGNAERHRRLSHPPSGSRTPRCRSPPPVLMHAVVPGCTKIRCSGGYGDCLVALAVRRPVAQAGESTVL